MLCVNFTCLNIKVFWAKKEALGRRPTLGFPLSINTKYTTGFIFKRNKSEICCCVDMNVIYLWVCICVWISLLTNLDGNLSRDSLQCLRLFGHYGLCRSISLFFSLLIWRLQCFKFAVITSQAIVALHVVREFYQWQGHRDEGGRVGDNISTKTFANKWLCGIVLVRHFLQTTEEDHLLFVYEGSPLFFSLI